MTAIDVNALVKAENAIESSRKSMCYKTVDVFSGICERKLWLRDATDGQPKTDGHMIEVPFVHARAYQYTEHEISHILFQSDLLAKVQFIEEYADKIGQVAANSGVTINVRELRLALSGVIDVLDDERVISLWGLLYRGSEAIMRTMKRDEAAPHIQRAHESLLDFFSALASGNDVPPGKLDRFRPYMVEALRKVHLRDYCGCLVTTKWLVVQLVSEIIRESRQLPPPPMPKPGKGPDKGDADDPKGSQAGSGGLPSDDSDQGPPLMPWEQDDAQGANESQSGGHGQEAWEPPPSASSDAHERAEALKDAIDKLDGQKYSRNNPQELQESKYKRRGEEQRAKRTARTAMNAAVKDTGKLEDALGASTAAMMNIVNKARHVVRNAMVHDDLIRKDSYAKVVFSDVLTSEHMNPHLKMGDDDEDTINRLRAIFHRVMGRRVNMLEEAGSQIDIPAYIQRRLTNDPIPVFRVSRHGRGFKTLILVDRSSSMHGHRTYQAERACRIISRALDFPFVTRSVWGFQSWKNGEVNITRFQAGQEMFDSNSARVGGTTPLHTAIRVGINELEDGTDKKHLFVISDGFPMFSRRDGAQFGTKMLMSFVKKNILEARSNGIGVTGVMIGNDVEAVDMEKMFGHSRHWRVMNDAAFGSGLIELVTGAFVEYLRSR